MSTSWLKLACGAFSGLRANVAGSRAKDVAFGREKHAGCCNRDS